METKYEQAIIIVDELTVSYS